MPVLDKVSSLISELNQAMAELLNKHDGVHGVCAVQEVMQDAEKTVKFMKENGLA
ncbi:MAG: hypothetical protein WC444_05265 [Candidatus Paceibacterota bacterium]